MKCHEVQEHLSAWMDGEAPEELRPLLADHLAGCPACRGELAVLERLDGALAGLGAPVPRDLAAKVRRRLPRPASRWVQSFALAACLVLGISLGSSLTGTLFPGAANGITNDVATLEIFQDYPQGSVGGAFSYQGEEDYSA